MFWTLCVGGAEQRQETQLMSGRGHTCTSPSGFIFRGPWRQQKTEPEGYLDLYQTDSTVVAQNIVQGAQRACEKWPQCIAADVDTNQLLINWCSELLLKVPVNKTRWQFGLYHFCKTWAHSVKWQLICLRKTVGALVSSASKTHNVWRLTSPMFCLS
jgi:hypothetical protein